MTPPELRMGSTMHAARLPTDCASIRSNPKSSCRRQSNSPDAVVKSGRYEFGAGIAKFPGVVGPGQAAQPGREVHGCAVDPLLVDDDLSDVDPEVEVQPGRRRFASAPSGRRHAVPEGREQADETVTQVDARDDAAAARDEGRADQVLQSAGDLAVADRAHLLGETRRVDDIGEEDDGVRGSRRGLRPGEGASRPRRA